MLRMMPARNATMGTPSGCRRDPSSTRVNASCRRSAQPICGGSPRACSRAITSDRPGVDEPVHALQRARTDLELLKSRRGH
jgi:hypothetical protein